MLKKIVIAALCLPLAGFAQTTYNTGIASNWNNWRVYGTNNLVAGTNSNVPFSGCMVQGDNSHLIPALSANTPIKIVDPGNPSIDEVVTPTAITPGPNCIATLVTTNAHVTPYYLVSGTFGLNEVINNIQSTAGLNAVNLNYNWHVAGGGAATIYGITNGSPQLSLLDVSITPAPTYRWNGTHYVPSYALLGTAVPTAAAGAAAGTGPTLTLNAGSSGNIWTLTVLTGTATTTGTLATVTVGTPLAAGNLNCTVSSMGANVPAGFTWTSASSSVVTLTVSVAPATATTYVFNGTCN
jgi:hypothetical protein